MNKSNPLRNLAVAGFVCLLAASCSDLTDDDGTTLPDGKYPMTFTASVDGLTATRATTDNNGKTSWQANDPVAISMDGGVNHKEYKISNAGTGAMIPDGEANTLYWQKSNETKTLAAWYPVSCTIGNSGGSEVNITDQHSSFGTLENVLHAPAQDYTYSSGNPVAFAFRHALAKVKVMLKKGDGIDDNDLSTATVTFTGYTTGSLGYNGMTGSEGSNGDITPKKGTAGGGATVYTALVVPQQMRGKKFIKVTVGANSDARDYYYIPSGADADLEAGKQYTYTITVKKTGLQVESVTALWTDNQMGDHNAAKATYRITLSGEQLPNFTASDNVTQVASNVYETTSGNSFSLTYTVPPGEDMKGLPVLKGLADMVRTSLGRDYTFTYTHIRSDLWLEYVDYRAVGDYYYADGTRSGIYTPDPSNPCIGIVFKLGAAGGDQPGKYDNESLSVIHGYVIALQDALPTAGNWGTRGVETPIPNVNNENVTDYTGYSDTQTIILTYSEGDTWNDYQAFKSIVDYRSSVPTPAVSSGWYLPSLAQLGDVYTALGAVSTPLETAGAALQVDNEGRYWTSSELTNRGNDAWYVKMNDGTKEAYGKNNSVEWVHPSYARAILTF